jgi:hypothetical protein
MPGTTSYDGTCVGGGANGLPVTSKDSYQQCIDAGGTYRAYSPDAGKKRVSGLALEEQLNGKGSVESHGNPFSDIEVSKRLLVFPICEVHRRTPRSRLLAKLDLLDRNFTDELNRVFKKDPDLRNRVSQLVLDISWIAARALSEEGSTAADGPVVSEDLITRARELGADVRNRTDNVELAAAITEAIDLSDEFRGVAVAEVLATLAGRNHKD